MIKISVLLSRIWSLCRRAESAVALALSLCGKAFRDLWVDGGFTQAAAISYYLVVSIFPMLLLLIGVAGFFLKPQDIQQEVLSWLSQYFPTGTRVVFRENIQSIIEVRGSVSVAGFLVLLWSCTLLFDAINQAVNAAWGTWANSRFFMDKFKSLLLICVIVIAAVFSAFLTTHVALEPRLEALMEKYPFMDRALYQGREAVASLMGMLIPFVLSVGAFGLAYRLLPRVRISTRDVWPAAVVAALLWEMSKRGFVWYLTEYTEYRQIYGSISAVLVLMLWAYISSLILAWGAELTAEIWKERRKTEAQDKADYPYPGPI
ncbi:MAG: YihY/virulence factor BrkB family protein [Acidobacteria bacterium]|nr:YihY/virulence factor BrkB family protein [Acidobacteriota bacterium]